jgi:hypothetical protein
MIPAEYTVDARRWVGRDGLNSRLGAGCRGGGNRQKDSTGAPGSRSRPGDSAGEMNHRLQVKGLREQVDHV